KTVRKLKIWYHVAAVYNASAATLDIYVNGALDNGVLLGTVPTSQFNAPVNALIAKRALDGFPFAGIIDNLRIYNRALSASEVLTDMNTAVGGGVQPKSVTLSINGNVLTSAAEKIAPVSGGMVAPAVQGMSPSRPQGRMSTLSCFP